MKTFMPSYGENDVGIANFQFSFLTNGGSAVDQTTIRGLKVASVTRSTTGTYTVVLDGPYRRVQTADATVFDDAVGTGGSASVYFAAEDGDPLTFTVFTKNAAGTVADLSARRVSVYLSLKVSGGT